MKLSVVLFTSKTLSDNSHPIMLRLFRKGKYYHHSLGISCKKTEWKENDKECRRSYPRYASFNKIIRDAKAHTQERIDAMIANKKPFRIEDIFYPLENKDTKTLIEVIEEHQSQYVKFNTLQKYRKLVRKLKELGHSRVLIDEVDALFLKTFYNSIKVGRKDTTVYTWMAVFEASLNTAVEKGYISENPFKYTNFKYDRTSQRRALSRYDIDKIIEYYKDNYSESIWTHEYSLSKMQTEYYALNLFLSSYYLQGLSLIDLARLRVKDVVITKKAKESKIDYKQHHQQNENIKLLFKTIEENIETNNQKDFFARLKEDTERKNAVATEEIMTIQTRRSKTNKPVKIVCHYGMIWFLLKPNMEGKVPDDYLFNIFNEKCENNEKYQFHRLTHTTNSCNRQLRDVSKKLELSIDNLTMYVARHTYASTLYHNGVSSNIIAQNLGRDIRDVDVYLKQFDDEAIIGANDILMTIQKE